LSLDRKKPHSHAEGADTRALTAIRDEIAARDPGSPIRYEKPNKLGNIRWNA